MSATLPTPTPAGPIQDHAYADYRFLYCNVCHLVVCPAVALSRHLSTQHRSIPCYQRKRVVNHFTSLLAHASQPDYGRPPLPPDHSQPVPFLPTYQGFACGKDDCRYMTQNFGCLKRHLSKAHALYRDARTPFVHCVTLQSWYSDTRAQYWIVGERGVAMRTERGQTQSDQLHALEAVQIREQERLVRAEHDNAVAEADCQKADSSTTPWLEYTHWPEQFAGRPIDILAATAVLPAKGCTADNVLGAWEGCSFISPKEDEMRLSRLTGAAVDTVFQRCLYTLKAVPELQRCWLKTFTLDGFNLKPFKPLARPATLRRYMAHWKQFLCFIFRAWRTEQPQREQIYGICFSTAQEALMAQVWALLGDEELKLEADGGLDKGTADGLLDCNSNCDSDCDSDCASDYDSDCDSDSELEEGLVEGVVKSDEGNDDSNNLDWEPDCSLGYPSDGGLIDGSVGPDDDSGQEDAESDTKLGRGLLLSERLFQLSCAFWTNISTTGITSHLPLVYFSSVLGIQRKDLVFRTAYHYTPYLAGLVYVGRLLMLEYALPRQAYETLGWPDCSACPNQLEQLQLMRKKYLCRGGGHPMARLLELLYQGRTIAKKEGARANISWSANGQILQLCLGLGPSQRQYHIDVSQFRAMIWITIQDCQNLLQELMFGWRPAVDLEAIQDNLVNRQVGWSFLKEPANRLESCYQQLSKKAWTSKNGLMVGNRWSRPRSKKYLRLATTFSLLLLVCIHFSGGMPGRAPEVTTIRYQNSRQVMRNVFVYNGRLAIITEYQKARSRTNHAFYVVRVLPLLVSEILFQYLAYVRPFTNSLAHEDPHENASAGSHTDSLLAFPAEKGEPWSSKQMTTAIKEQAQKTCKAPLGMAAYRQAIIAIAKRHVADIAKPFNLYAATTNATTHSPWLWFARQTSHTLQMFATSYAIDQSHPTRLQPELIRQYEIVSGQWHQWLRMGELEQKLTAQRSQDVRTSLCRATVAAPQPPPRQPQKRPLEQHQPEVQPVRLAKGLVVSLLNPPPTRPQEQPQVQPQKQPKAQPLQLPAGSVGSQLDRRLARKLDELQDQLPRLKRMIDDPAQARRPIKRQAGARPATVLPFTTPPSSPAPTYGTRARPDLILPATPPAPAIGKGGCVDLIDLTGSPTPIIDMTTSSPAPARCPLVSLSSSAFNKGLGELQTLLNENPWI